MRADLLRSSRAVVDSLAVRRRLEWPLGYVILMGSDLERSERWTSAIIDAGRSEMSWSGRSMLYVVRRSSTPNAHKLIFTFSSSLTALIHPVSICVCHFESVHG